MDQVQLFISDINQLGPVEYTLPFLNAEEKERFSRFQDENARALFGHGRRMMKSLLGMRLKRDPRDVSFAYNDHGKPYLSQELNMHFNLSHSGNFLCFGMAPVPLGVDIEAHKNIEFMDVARTVYTTGEIARISQIPAIETPELFYSFWTRKEAFIKCQGYGLSFPLPLTQVDIQNDKVRLDIVIAPGSQWDYPYTIRSFTPQAGYSGAVVVRAASFEIQMKTWA